MPGSSVSFLRQMSQNGSLFHGASVSASVGWWNKEDLNAGDWEAAVSNQSHLFVIFQNEFQRIHKTGLSGSKRKQKYTVQARRDTNTRQLDIWVNETQVQTIGEIKHRGSKNKTREINCQKKGSKMSINKKDKDTRGKDKTEENPR